MITSATQSFIKFVNNNNTTITQENVNKTKTIVYCSAIRIAYKNKFMVLVVYSIFVLVSCVIIVNIIIKIKTSISPSTVAKTEASSSATTIYNIIITNTIYMHDNKDNNNNYNSHFKRVLPKVQSSKNTTALFSTKFR